MNNLWQLWDSGISLDGVNSIILESEQYPIAETGLGFDGITDNKNYRSSEIKWVSPDASPGIANQLWYFAKEANRNAFGFDISLLRDIQYTKYKAENNGKYDWHVDTFWANPTTFDRKLSIVIQLSDPSDYEGGKFEFDHQYEQPNSEALKKKGTVLVFPSFLSHRVTPITSGTRKSLVSWVEGPKFR